MEYLAEKWDQDEKRTWQMFREVRESMWIPVEVVHENWDEAGVQSWQELMGLLVPAA